MIASLFVRHPVRAADREQVIRTNKTGTLMTGVGDVRRQAGGKDEAQATYPSDLDFGDSLRTLLRSSAAVEFKDRSSFKMRDRTRLIIAAMEGNTNSAVIRLLEGQVYHSHRGPARSFPVETPYLAAVPRGTEFLVSVDLEASETTVAMFDGEVELTQANETKIIRSGEFGVAAPNQPLRVGRIEAANIVQWWIYYPGVVDPSELELGDDLKRNFEASIDTYRRGDLRAALDKLPAGANLLNPPANDEGA